MRHLTKQLLAGFFALTLFFSSGTNAAFAVQLHTYGGGHATGSTTNQGGVTEGILNVVLPSVQQEFFDFILDPENLIMNTHAAAYNGISYEEGNFYFINTASGEPKLSPDSNPLTIINKGVVPVDVSVSLAVNKGSYNFTFANSPDFQDASGNAINGDAMYLALASGRRTVPVTTTTQDSVTTHTASIHSWIGVREDSHDVEWNNERETYGYVVKEGLEDEDFYSASFYVTGAIKGDGWAEADSGVNLSVVWDISYERSNATANPYSDPDIQASVQVTSATRTDGEEIVLLVDMGAGAKRMTSVDKITWKRPSGKVITLDNFTVERASEYAQNVTFNAPTSLLNLTDWTIYLSNASGGSEELSFNPVAEETIPPDPQATVVSKAAAAGDTVVLEVTYGTGATAYPNVERVSYKKTDGSSAALLALSKSGATEKGVTVSFNATSALLTGSEWKLVMSNSSGETTSLDIDIFDANVQSSAPTATVTSKASASGDLVSLTLDYGSGASVYPYVDKIVYTSASGTSATVSASSLTVNGSTVTFTITDALIKGKDWKIVLSNRASEMIELDVDIYEPPAVNPSVTVTQKASAAGESAIMTVDWGSGAKAMTSISKIAYTNASGASATITGSAIQTNGNNVSVTFDATSVQGKNFIVVFANASGATYELQTSLLEEPAVDPKVTVIKKAAASGDTAIMTVDWGSGAKAMTSVSKVTYTNASGKAATISGSSIQTSGNTVTVTFNATSIKGKDFELVLTNASNKTFEASVDLASNGTGSGLPSVTVIKAVSAAKDQASLTVDFGNTGMKKVIAMSYRMKGATTATVVNAGVGTVLVNGASVTITAANAIFNGSEWRLILSDDSGNKTAELPFNLKQTGKVVGATATVTSPVTEVRGTATVTVNFGESMSQVSAMTYRMNGAAALTTVAPGTGVVTVEGNTVTIRAAAAVFNGSEWSLRLSNQDGSMFINVPINIKTAG